MKNIILFALIMISNTTFAAGFRCSDAATDIEKEICSDISLSRLDSALNDNYKSMLSAEIGSTTKERLQQSQRDWLVERNQCNTKDCLISKYKVRLDEICKIPVINGIQPICETSDNF